MNELKDPMLVASFIGSGWIWTPSSSLALFIYICICMTVSPRLIAFPGVDVAMELFSVFKCVYYFRKGGGLRKPSS